MTPNLSQYMPLMRSERLAAILLLDPEGRIKDVNWLLRGLSAEDVQGKPLTDFVIPDDRQIVGDAIRRCVATGQVERYLSRAAADYGLTTTYVVTLLPVLSEGTIKELLMFALDLGPWDAQIQALSRSNQEILRAISVAAEGIAVLHDGRYTYMNPSHAQMYGFEAPELTGKSWEELYDEKERTRIQTEVFPLLARDGFWSGTCQGHKKDGSYFEVELGLRLYEGGNLVCTCRDVTIRNEVDRQLLHSRDELQRLNQVKDNFLAMVSHELRTPLASILGYSEALIRGVYGELNQRQQKAVSSLAFSAQYQLQLVNDLLDLSRIESNSLTLDPGAYPLSLITKSACELVINVARQKGIRLSYVETDRDGLVFVDRTRLIQFLVNVLNNAVKYSGDNTEIVVSVEGDKDNLRCRVTDQGFGIPPEDLEKLFEPFFRGRIANETQDGAGLGLPLAKRLVELQGGTIAVDSVVGVGTTATVTLPRQTSQPADLQNASSAGAERPQSKEGRSGQILLVEDAVELAELLSDFLRCEHYKVDWLTSGETVIGNLRSKQYDLVILDDQLPGKDGFSVLREIREDPDPNIASTPVLALTAHAMAEDRKRFVAAGANDYLSKPVSLANLLRAIEQLAVAP
jgi:PAS domain S-box-containing protein